MKFNITVTDKVAFSPNAPEIVCGNADYVIDFEFDAEWDEYEIKTAVFTYKRKGQNKYKEVVFTGTECNMPVLSGIDEVNVGVYAGNLHTTTPAKLNCKKSALCDITKIDDTPTSVYNQLLEILKDNYPVEAGVRANEAAQETEEYLQTAKADMTEFTNNVELQIANILNFAPKTLDTLAEIAEALGNDPNFATTITNLIANTKKELNNSIAATNTEVAKKVDKKDGKGLSANDFTTEEKNKLAAVLTEEQIVSLIAGDVLWQNQVPESEQQFNSASCILPFEEYKRIRIIYTQRGYKLSEAKWPYYQIDVNIDEKGTKNVVLETTDMTTTAISFYQRKVEIYKSDTVGVSAVRFFDANTGTIKYNDGESTPSFTVSTANGFMVPQKIIGYKY